METAQLAANAADALALEGRTLGTDPKNFFTAKVLIDQAIRMDPAWFRSYCQMAYIHNRAMKFNDAYQYAVRACVLQPLLAETHMNLAFAAFHTGRFDIVIDEYATAVRLDPSIAEARTYYASTCMLVGDWDEGLTHYEGRFLHLPLSFDPRSRMWNGECLRGMSITVYMEQGAGDAIQCARYAHALKKFYHAREVNFVARPELVKLLEFADEVDHVSAYETELIQTDYHIAAFSIMRHMRRDHGVNAMFYPRRAYMGEGVKLGLVRTVGLCWRGNPQHNNDLFRSMKLSDFDPVLPKEDGYPWVSLQWGEDGLAAKYGLTGLGDKTLLEFAIYLRRTCRLVISVDTMVAHLAAAMGIETWLLVSANPDWRWGTVGMSAPWYPSMRLFRQKKLGDWKPVVQEVREALTAIGANA